MANVYFSGSRTHNGERGCSVSCIETTVGDEGGRLQAMLDKEESMGNNGLQNDCEGGREGKKEGE